MYRTASRPNETRSNIYRSLPPSTAENLAGETEHRSVDCSCTPTENAPSTAVVNHYRGGGGRHLENACPSTFYSPLNCDGVGNDSDSFVVACRCRRSICYSGRVEGFRQILALHLLLQQVYPLESRREVDVVRQPHLPVSVRIDRLSIVGHQQQPKIR